MTTIPDKAIQANKETILTLLHSSGPQTRDQVKRECAIHAYPHDDAVDLAIEGLLKGGQIAIDIDNKTEIYEIKKGSLQ